MTLARYCCPACGAVYDVWLENDGRPEKAPWCPSCKWLGRLVAGEYDEKETALLLGGDAA